jgi:hypothetical protein
MEYIAMGMGIIAFMIFVGLIALLLLMIAWMCTKVKEAVDIDKDPEMPICPPEPRPEITSPSVNAFKTFMINKYHRERANKNTGTIA